jgi:hypothetical protein
MHRWLEERNNEHTQGMNDPGRLPFGLPVGAIARKNSLWISEMKSAVKSVDHVVMALAVFVRGVNVGGHKSFRPSLVANQLSDFDDCRLQSACTKPGAHRRRSFVSDVQRRPRVCSSRQ